MTAPIDTPEDWLDSPEPEAPAALTEEFVHDVCVRVAMRHVASRRRELEHAQRRLSRALRDAIDAREALEADLAIGIQMVREAAEARRGG